MTIDALAINLFNIVAEELSDIFSRNEKATVSKG